MADSPVSADAHSPTWRGTIEQWLFDLRIAFRSLARAPVFALAVIVTLVLCLGPNTAILSALYGLVLKPLPFRAPHELVVVSNLAEKGGRIAVDPGIPQWRDFKANADRFAGFALFDSANSTIGEESAPVRVIGARVTSDFFSVLGLAPERGRFFTPADDIAGQDRLLVLTDTFWRVRFNADPAIIGREMRMGGDPFTVVGVAPPALEAMFLRTDFFKPYGYAERDTAPERRYGGGRGKLLARLKPGVAPAAGLAQLQTLEKRFREEQASAPMRAQLERMDVHATMDPFVNPAVNLLRQPLWLLEAGAVFVLLIGCVNVVNLLLARANARRSELAIRYALGAGRAALWRRVAAETAVLGAVAFVVGLGAAWAALQVINRYLPFAAREAAVVRLEPPVLAAMGAAAIVIAIVMATVPFVLLWRTGLRVGDARTGASSRAVRLVGAGLIVAQVGIAVVLLVGAGLLVRSFAKVVAVDPGFATDTVMQGRIAFPHTYDAPVDNFAVRRRILAAMREIPGVEGVGSVGYFGVGPASSFRAIPYTVRSAPTAPGENPPVAYIDSISAGTFAAMGVRVVEGREFNESDDAGQNPVVIVDEALARRHFPGRSALGEELVPGSGNFPADFKWPRIVGVVRRANRAGLEERDGPPFLYRPLGQGSTPGINLLVRSRRAPGDLLAAMRVKLRDIDPALPLYNTGTLRAALDDMLMRRRGVMLLLAAFAGVALLLAAVGLYGVLAYDVSQRTREIGIRSAIGASRRQIMALVIRQGLWRTGVGLVFGLGGALALARAMRGLLFDVAPVDPIAFLALPAALLLVTALACWLPARRAAQVDPMIALRAE